MKILYLHQYFITPKEAGGARSYYLAKKLVEASHEVVMITSNTRHEEWPFVETRHIDGIKVIYIKNFYDSRMGKYARILSYVKFMFYSTFFALIEKNVDTVFASSTPITIGIPALAVKYLKKTRFIFELRDIWPDIPFEMGYIKNRFFYKVLKKFERLLYKKADKIITISEGIKEKVGVDFAYKTLTFPFGANLDLFTASKNGRWKEEKGIDARVLYVFTGAVGIANGVEYLVEAARILQEKDSRDVHIAIVGDGSAKAKIVSLVEVYSLRNVSLHDSVPVETLDDIYASADAGIILFGDKSESYRQTASPNKFFDYMGAGLPIFFNFAGPLRDIVETKNIGIYTDYKDPAALSSVMRYYADHPDDLMQMSKNARKYAVDACDREKILDALVVEITENPQRGKAGIEL